MSAAPAPEPAGLDRRTALVWAGALAAALGAADHFGLSLTAPAKGATGAGYGTDPDLLKPVVPWPRLLTDAQRDAVAAFVDFILPREGAVPGASDVGVHHLIDEWVSAPYPEQSADRALILSGLDHMDFQARRTGGARDFAAAPPAVRATILEALADPAQAMPPEGFYERLRRLTIGAYYTTEAGFADIGYIGNQPLKEFPAPSAEVLAVLDAAYARLGLADRTAAARDLQHDVSSNPPRIAAARGDHHA